MTEIPRDARGGGIHPLALQGFARSPEAYESGRPGYPDEAWRMLKEALRLESARCIVELGAGTGKFTRLLAGLPGRTVAIEPVAAMRKDLQARVPDVWIVGGRAEHVPLRRRAADAVVCAQAFHWFDADGALRELRRVLRPGGRLGLIWNVRDERCDWIRGLTEIMDPYGADAPRYRTAAWRRAFGAAGEFTSLKEMHFEHIVPSTPEAVVQRVASVSFIASLPDSEHEKVLDSTRRLLSSHPATRGRETLSFPYRVDIFWCERIAEGESG